MGSAIRFASVEIAGTAAGVAIVGAGSTYLNNNEDNTE